MQDENFLSALNGRLNGACSIRIKSGPKMPVEAELSKNQAHKAMATSYRLDDQRFKICAEFPDNAHVAVR